MSGRAGRRGIDDRGIVMLMVDEQMDSTVGKNLLRVMSTHAHTHMCTCMYMHVHKYKHTSTSTHNIADTHTHTHTHTTLVGVHEMHG